MSRTKMFVVSTHSGSSNSGMSGSSLEAANDSSEVGKIQMRPCWTWQGNEDVLAHAARALLLTAGKFVQFANCGILTQTPSLSNSHP
jgi:hypothetical protein